MTRWVPQMPSIKTTASLLLRVLVILSILVLAGCNGPLSTLDPSGPRAAMVAMLWWAMFWSSVALFGLMMALLALVWVRPGFGSKLAPSKWIIYGGLVMPGILLPVLVGYALYTGNRLLPHALDTAPARINAQGVMWQWQFSYPELGDLGSTGVLHIPAGKPVDIVVTSGDVIHSFWVPRLTGKIDAIPGRENIIRIQADRPGSYQGVCAEFCGRGHTEMRFQVRAHAPEEYESAVLEAAE